MKQLRFSVKSHSLSCFDALLIDSNDFESCGRHDLGYDFCRYWKLR